MVYHFTTEDKNEAKILQNAFDYHSALWELRERIRRSRKYDDKLTIDDIWDDLIEVDLDE